MKITTFALLALMPGVACAQTMNLLGVASSTPARGASAALIRDAWGWQTERHACVYATADVAAVRATLGDALAAGLIRSLLKVEPAPEVMGIQRLTARSVFADLKAHDAFVVVDGPIGPARLAELVASRAGTTPDVFDEGGRMYATVPVGAGHSMTATTLADGRVQAAFHATEGDVSLLATDAPQNGRNAASLDLAALISVRVTQPRLIPDVSGAGIVKDAMRNGVKNTLVGSVANLDARVVRAGEALKLEITLTPVAGTSPAELGRRYETLRASAGLAGSQARAMFDRLRMAPRGTVLVVEMVAGAAELAPYLERLTRGEMPWS